MASNSNSCQSSNNQDLQESNSLEKQNEDLFGFLQCQLQKKVEIGQPIIYNRRCNFQCNQYTFYDNICLSSIQKKKLPLTTKLNFQKAQHFNNQKIESNFSNKTKKIRKIKKLFNQNYQIKKNSYLIRKLTQLAFTKYYISNLTGLSKNYIYYREYQISQSNQFQTQFYFEQIHLDWLQKYVQTQKIQELWNSQLILAAFKLYFSLENQIIGIKKFRECLTKNGLSYKQILQGSFGYFKKSRIRKVKKYCIDLLSSINDEFKTIYIDETTFAHQSRNPKCWQQKKNQKFRKLVNLQKSVNLMGGIGQNGSQIFQICIGNVNQFVFGQFLEKLIISATEFYKNQKFLIILDNCPTQQSKMNINYLFLAPQTPELNPIEKIWKLLKEQIYKSQPCDKLQLLRTIHGVLKKNISSLIEPLITNTQTQIKRSFNNDNVEI